MNSTKKVIMLAVFWSWGIVLSVGQDNTCTEYGPYYGAPWCCTPAVVTASGSLSFSTAYTCVNQGVTLPTASGTTFYYGQDCRTVSYDCPENIPWTDVQDLTGTQSALYWVPSIPATFSAPGVYTFTAYIDGTPNGTCPKVTATVGNLTVIVVQAQIKSVTFTSDYPYLLSWTGDFATRGTPGAYFNPRGWSLSPSANNPVMHTQGRNVVISAVVNVAPADIRYDLVGNGPIGALTFHGGDTFATATDQTLQLTSGAALPAQVDILNDSITWTVTIPDGSISCDAGSSGPHKIYVTWGDHLLYNQPDYNDATLKRVDWACTVAQGATSITSAAESFWNKLAASPGGGGYSRYPYSWGLLDDMPSYGADCATLAATAVLGLRTIGIDANLGQAWPTLDATATTNTCQSMVPFQNFSYQGQSFQGHLIWDSNQNLEGFFFVNDPDYKSYTIYPRTGPLVNKPDYKCLQALSAAMSKLNVRDQFWGWNGNQTINGVSVYDGQDCGVAHVPLPSVP